MLMNRLSLSLISLAALAIFCATLTYWIVTLASPAPLPVDAAAARPSPSMTAAAQLFGGDHTQDTRIRLAGVLNLGAGRGSAAIISLDGAAGRAIGVGQAIANNIKLAEVRARSVIIDRDGVRSEIALSDTTPGGTGGIIYMH